MAKSQIYDLIAKINAILGKPLSQILSGLSPKYYAKILQQREALLQVRSQLERAIAQNQSVSEQAAADYLQRIIELETAMEQPVTASLNEVQPKLNLPNHGKIVEPEAELGHKTETSELGKTEILEAPPNLIDRLSEKFSEQLIERLAEKVYDRLLAVVSQEQRSQLTEEIARLEAVKQNLSQEVDLLTLTKTEKLTNFNQQQQQHQDAYADSVDFLNQFLDHGIRQPLQAAKLEMDLLKTETEKVNQAIAQISVANILEPINTEYVAQSQSFLEEFILRLNALFAKTLPTLAEQIKTLRQEVDLSLESWQSKFDRHSELISTFLGNWQTQIQAQVESTISEIEAKNQAMTIVQAEEQQTLIQILPRLTEIEANLLHSTAISSQAFDQVLNIEQAIAQAFGDMGMQQTTTFTAIAEIQALLEDLANQSLRMELKTNQKIEQIEQSLLVLQQSNVALLQQPQITQPILSNVKVQLEEEILEVPEIESIQAIAQMQEISEPQVILEVQENSESQATNELDLLLEELNQPLDLDSYSLNSDQEQQVNLIAEQSIENPIQLTEQFRVAPQIELDLELDDCDRSEFDFSSLNSFADSEEPTAEIKLEFDVGVDSEINAEIRPLITSQTISEIRSETLSEIQPPADQIPELDKQLSREKWILGIDFNGSTIQAWLYEISSTRQIELAPIEAVAEVLNPEDYSANTIMVTNFKPFLQLGLPYLANDSWYPQIQWQRSLKLNLQALISGCQDLFQQLEIPKPIRANIQNVVLAKPPAWSDIYSLNLREAVLAAELVARPEQVMIIDQAIAPLLDQIQQDSIQYPAILIDANIDSLCFALVGSANQRNGHKSAIVTGISTSSYDYSGYGIAQDILTQLIYSRWRNAKNPNRDACNLNQISLPSLAMSDSAKRMILQQHLDETEAGQQLWQAANQIMEQMWLGEKEEFELEVIDYKITISAREVENQILQLFTQRISHQLNSLMANGVGNPIEINQILLSGKFTQFPSLHRWLGQKFNQAEIIILSENTIAKGLAIAPLYTPMLDLASQQYSDYFLLNEICNLKLQDPVSAESLTRQLRNRGINTNVCEQRISQILNSEINAQLFPWQDLENQLFFTDSLLHRELAKGKLFELTSERNYQPNPLQFRMLEIYLELVSGYLHQNLAEPLVLALVT